MSEEQPKTSFSTLPTGTFAMHNMSDTEVVQGAIFNNAQMMSLHNLRATYAEEKLATVIDVNDVLASAQQEARLLGMLEILNFLMDNSEAVNYNLNNPQINQDI